MRAAIPGQRSWGGSMPFGRRPTASCSSRSFIAPASPVAGAGRETAALSRCLLLYPRARRSRRARSLRRRRARTPPALRPAALRSPARDRCSNGGAQLVPEPHEHILGALLGVARVARQAETERVHTAGMLAVQLPKSGLVAGLGPGDQIVRWGHSTKTPCGAAAFGPGPSRQPHAAEQLPQPLFEGLLELVDPRALLRDPGLRLCLHLGHPRAHRTDPGVYQRVDATAHLFLSGVDLRAELRAQPRRDRLIEV